MSTLVLGVHEFEETPTVAGVPVLLNSGGVPSILSDALAARPAAGTVGRLFVDTTNNELQRDTGSSWVTVGGIPPDAVFPGTGAVTVPIGTTAQRPSSPTNGMIRYNSTLNYFERYTDNSWVPFGQLAQYLSDNISQASGTTIIPYDSTTPVSSEGTELWSQSITPSTTTSSIVILFTGMCDTGTNNRGVTFAVFRGTTCIVAQTSWISTANRPQAFAIHVRDLPATTSATTYSVRVGISSGGTWFVGRGQNATLGGVTGAAWSLLEVI